MRETRGENVCATDAKESQERELRETEKMPTFGRCQDQLNLCLFVTSL